MRNLYKKHPNLTAFIIYAILSLIILLPAIILITQNIAINLNGFSINAKFFETINSIQNNFPNQNIILIVYEILNPLAIGYIFHLIFSEPLGFNLFWILQFIFGAFGGYLLLNCLFKEREFFSSFMAGTLFGILSLLFYPVILILYLLLFLLKFLEKPDIRNGLLAIIFYFFLVSFSLFFSITTLFLILIIIACRVLPVIKELIKRDHRYNLYKILILFSLFILIFSGKYYFPLRNIEPFELSNPLFLTNSLDSTSVINIFNISNYFSVIIFLVTISILILLLFIIFALKAWKANKWIGCSLFFTILFLIFSLGPYLKLYGSYSEPQISLPYTFLFYFLPYFNQTLEIENFIVFALFFLIILVSFGIKAFHKQFILTKKTKALFSASLILLLIIILWTFWQPGNKIPEHYNKVGGSDKILFLTPLDRENLSFYSEKSNSNNPVISRGIFNDNFENRMFINSENPIDSLLNNSTGGREIEYGSFIDHDFATTFSSYLAKDNIGYIAIDSDFIKKSKTKNKYENFFAFRKILKFIKQNTTGKWVIAGDYIIYEIRSEAESSITIFQGENWAETDFNENVYKNEKRKELFKEKWMHNDSTLVLDNPTNEKKNTELFFKARSKSSMRKLKVYLNEELITSFLIGPKSKAYLVNLKSLSLGENMIRFEALNYNDNKLKVTKDNSDDSIHFCAIKQREIGDTNALKFYEELELNDDSKILMPIESDELKANNSFISYEDIISNQEEKIKFLPILDQIYFNDFETHGALDIFNRDYYYSSGQEAINKYNIEYIAIYKNWMQQNRFSELVKFIINNTRIKGIPINDENVLVFEIDNLEVEKQIPLEFTNNWLILKKPASQMYYNTAPNGAKVKLNNPEDTNIDANLHFAMANLGKKRKIKIYLNQDWIKDQELVTIHTPAQNTEKDFDIELKDLEPGKNEVTFRIFDKNDEKIKKIEDNVKMFDFKIEKKGVASKEEASQEVNYCSEKIMSIFDNESLKKTYIDGFENEDFTIQNSYLDWQVKFAQQEKYKGRQVLQLFTFGSNGYTKNIYGCHDKITANIMMKINAWPKGASLMFNFINDENKLFIRPPAGQVQKTYIEFLTRNTGIYNDGLEEERFKLNLPLYKWTKLKLIWEATGNIELWEGNSRILKAENFDQQVPNGIRIFMNGNGAQTEPELYFDDLEINFE